MDVYNTSLPLPFSYTFTSSSSSTTSSDTNSSPWMDGRIWSKLPTKLLDRVIAFLPPPAFARSRCVCKRWYSLLFSTTFLQLHMQLSPPCNWFLFFKHKTLTSYIYKNKNNNTRSNYIEGYLFDPSSITWYRISFSLIPSGFYPASSSGGLVCFVSDESGTKNILLSNPLVNTISQLPPTITPRLFPSIGLSVTPTSIDLTIAGDDMISPFAVKNLTSETFHIDAGGFFSLWETTSSLPRLCNLESGKMVNIGQKLYCMNYSPFSVISYEITTNSWFKIQAPMRRFLRSPSLVENKGKLILVAAVEKSKLNIPKSLRLWSLQSCGTTWVEIERMPQQLYVQFWDEEGGRGFDCVGHGEFVVIVIRGGEKALLFDTWRKRWQWIPPCPYTHANQFDDGGGEGELQGFPYEPKLATPVTALLGHLTLPFQTFAG